MKLTDSQQAELATGRVVVAVPCDPQPPHEIDSQYEWNIVKRGAEFDFCCEREHPPGIDHHGGIEHVLWGTLTAPHKPGDKIPTPAGDAIVRDVDVKFAEVWEWVVTIELEQGK